MKAAPTLDQFYQHVLMVLLFSQGLQPKGSLLTLTYFLPPHRWLFPQPGAASQPPLHLVQRVQWRKHINNHVGHLKKKKQNPARTPSEILRSLGEAPVISICPKHPGDPDVRPDVL